MKFKDCAVITGVLTGLSLEDCTTRLQQAKRAAYQKLGQPANQLTAATILTKAGWDTLTGAIDDKKVVLPKKLFYNPEGGGTEPVKIGSNDNTTPDGRSILVGESVPMFTASYNGLSPADYSAMEDLFDWGNKNVDFETIGAHFFLGDRQVMTMSDFQPIPIRAPFIGSPTWGKLQELTLFNVQFELPKGWYRDVQIVTLNFDHIKLKN